MGWGGFCGRGRFSKRSTSPPDPSPEEWLGIGLSVLLEVCAHASWVWFPVYWLSPRRLTEPPRPANMPRPFEATHTSKPPLKGEVSAVGGRRGSVPPHRIGRGGSVSRRDHSQAYRRPTILSGGATYAEAHKPNASCSSGEGVWGRGASLREAASPPESPHALYANARSYSGRE